MLGIALRRPILTAVIEAHASRYPSTPFFFMETSELVDFILNEGIEDTEHQAIDALDEHKSMMVRHVLREWYCKYEPCHEIWLFNKAPTRAAQDHTDFIQNEMLKKTLKNQLFDLSPREFEFFLFELFSGIPDYDDPISRPMSRDGGYEMCVCFTDPITNSRDRILVQAKHEKRPLTVSHTRELIGTLDIERTRNGRNKRIRGLMVSLMPPTPASEAAAEATRHSIDFLYAENLVELMIRYNVGCSTEKTVRNFVDTTFWSEIRGE